MCFYEWEIVIDWEGKFYTILYIVAGFPTFELYI